MPNWVKNIVWIESPNLEVIKQIKEFFGDLNFDNIVPTPETMNIDVGGFSENAYITYISLISNDINIKNNAIERLKNNKWFNELVYIEDPKNPESIFGLRSNDISYLYKPAEKNENGFPKQRSPKNKGDFFMLGRMQYINFIKFGSKDWYDFSCNNWGTKWSAYYSWDDEEENNWYKEYKQGDIYIIRYEFRTAWSFPYAIYDEFFFNFGFRKDIRVNIQWADEDYNSYNQGWGLKDYNNMVFNTMQMIPVCIMDEREKFACMLWNDDYEIYKKEEIYRNEEDKL